MKQPSKADQLRALREARYAGSTQPELDKALAHLLPAAPMITNVIPPVALPKRRPSPKALIAPAGECPYCDARRAKNAAWQKKHRDKLTEPQATMRKRRAKPKDQE